jgi:hypothetical protein
MSTLLLWYWLRFFEAVQSYRGQKQEREQEAPLRGEEPLR